MKLASEELNGQDAKDLAALFEEVRAIDAAIERSATGDIRPGDVLLLRRNGFIGPEQIKQEYENRVKPIRVRAQQAGTHAEYAAAQQRVTDAEVNLEKKTAELTPKIEQAREALRALEMKLNAAGADLEEARERLDVMTTARDLLTDKLLPPMLRPMHELNKKRAYAEFHPKVQSIRSDMGRPNIDGTARDELQRQLDAVEAEFKAAVPLLDCYILPGDSAE